MTDYKFTYMRYNTKKTVDDMSEVHTEEMFVSRFDDEFLEEVNRRIRDNWTLTLVEKV